MLNDYLISVIRTTTPAIIASGLTWLSMHYGIVLDERTSAELGIASTILVLSAYYAVIRALESRYPLLGVLLGVKNRPNYTNGQLNEIESRSEE